MARRVITSAIYEAEVANARLERDLVALWREMDLGPLPGRYPDVEKMLERTRQLQGHSEAKEDLLRLWVPGTPCPQGSKTLVRSKSNHSYMIESNANKLRKWRRAVAEFAAHEWHHGPPIEGPVVLSVVFFFIRPKSHYLKSGAVTKRAPTHKVGKPDMSKLIRPIEDSLTDAMVWGDDSQVVGYFEPTHKEYSKDTEGVSIRVRRP